MQPSKTPGNIAFTPICNAELQESQDEEITNLGESQEYEVQSAFSKDAASEIQDRSATAHLRVPKRKRGKSTLSYQEEMISLENKKLEWVINPYPTAFPYGNGMVLHFYQQQESSTTETVHKVINKGLKAYV